MGSCHRFVRLVIFAHSVAHLSVRVAPNEVTFLIRRGCSLLCPDELDSSLFFLLSVDLQRYLLLGLLINVTQIDCDVVLFPEVPLRELFGHAVTLHRLMELNNA